MSVSKRARSEASLIRLNIGAGEYLQYLVSTRSPRPRFSLMDANSHEIILSDRATATILNPQTYTRLWPVVGDRPQNQSSLILSMNFPEAQCEYGFQVHVRRADGMWVVATDIDFESADGGDSFLYGFEVLAE